MSEYITYKQWDSAFRRIEKKNLKTNGRSTSWVSMMNQANDLVIEVRDFERVMVVKDNWRKELRARFEEPRPTSAPAAIKQVSVAVEVDALKASVTAQDAPNFNATGKQVNHITDWILKAKILVSIDELNWRRELSGGTWLDDWFENGVLYD